MYIETEREAARPRLRLEYAATNQKALQPLTLKEARKDPPQETSEGAWPPAHTLNLNSAFRTVKGYISRCCKPNDLWLFVTSATGHKNPARTLKFSKDPDHIGMETLTPAVVPDPTSQVACLPGVASPHPQLCLSHPAPHRRGFAGWLDALLPLGLLPVRLPFPPGLLTQISAYRSGLSSYHGPCFIFPISLIATRKTHTCLSVPTSRTLAPVR